MAFQTLVVLLGLLLTCHVRAQCRFDAQCASLMFLGIEGMNDCTNCNPNGVDCRSCAHGFGLVAGLCTYCADTEYSDGMTCLNF